LRLASWASSLDTLTIDDLLRAAQHLGLKAKLSKTTVQRLSLTPLPALALMRSGEAPAANPDAAQNQSPNQSQSETLNLVILAQCDGQRVLYQNFNNATAAPTIEQLDVFASHWSGSLILISSRASQAGALAKFDFSWFVPAMVKYRKLLGEVLLISFMLQLFGLVSPLFF
jgi:ATP-binding cassette, subfamily B, bacterial HlyB/CyaB